MKKLICLLAVFTLTVTLFSGAFAAGTVFETPYFTLELPEGWEIDQEELDKESEEGLEVLGYFGESAEIGLAAQVVLANYVDLNDFSLWNADEEGFQQYVDMLMEEFANDNPQNLGIQNVGGIPFVLIKCSYQDGEYLYVDTITNGHAVEFVAVVSDYGEKYYPFTDDYIELFKTILATFKPKQNT